MKRAENQSRRPARRRARAENFPVLLVLLVLAVTAACSAPPAPDGDAAAARLADKAAAAGESSDTAGKDVGAAPERDAGIAADGDSAAAAGADAGTTPDGDADAAGGGEKAPEPDMAALQERMRAAYAAEDYAGTVETAEKLFEKTAEQHFEVLYTAAAASHKMGKENEAYQWLELMLDSGYWDFRRLLTDEDFAGLKETEKFRTMVRGAWARQYIDMLERPGRAAFQKPAEVMAALAFEPGERVADVGAGSGYFTIPVAKAVGPEGRVLAIDIRQEMLDYIENRLEEEKLDNVELRLVQPDDPELPAGGVDTILMVDTLHYITERSAYAEKLRAGLAPGGRVVIIDYRPKPFEERPWGPPPEQQISRETVDAEFAAAGLRPVEAHEFLPEQYFVIYKAE